MAGIFDPKIFQNEAGSVGQKLFQVSVSVGGPGGLKKHHTNYLEQLELWWARIRHEKRLELERSKKKKKTKKQTLLDELDEMLAVLHARIEDAPQEAEPDWVPEFHRTTAFMTSSALAEASAAQLQTSLSLVQEIVREMDDEEFLFLAIH